MSDHAALQHGEFEIAEEPLDVFRGLYAQLGFLALYCVLAWVGSLVYVAWALLAGEWPSSMAGIFAATLTLSAGALVVAGLRVRGQRWTIAISDESIVARRPTGAVTLNWSAISNVKQGAGILVLYADRLAIALPVYRMSSVQVAAIRARIAALGSEKRVNQASRTRFFALWVFLVLLFVAIYNFFEAPPP